MKLITVLILVLSTVAFLALFGGFAYYCGQYKADKDNLGVWTANYFYGQGFNACEMQLNSRKDDNTKQ